jgi:hypothetical protein
MAEYCPYCNYETGFDFKKAIANNGKIICEHCGKEIMACSICSHRLNGAGCNSKNCFKYDSDFEEELEA